MAIQVPRQIGADKYDSHIRPQKTHLFNVITVVAAFVDGLEDPTMTVLDIPLLYESRGAARCDYVIVVSAPAMVQRQRVLRRPGMTEARFAAILKQQMPDMEKRRRADFVVPTGLDRNLSLRRLRAIIAALRRHGPQKGRPRRGIRRNHRRAA